MPAESEMGFGVDAASWSLQWLRCWSVSDMVLVGWMERARISDSIAAMGMVISLSVARRVR